MYRLIIVDDEKVVREGLRQFINWNDLGFDLIGDFKDGKEAIEFLNMNKVDVVMTDIEMLHINGIELSHYIYQHCPDTKTILVSGHKDFEYAKKAIEYGVTMYLTKPAEIDEIKTLFNELKQELDQEDLKKSQYNLFKQKYQEVVPLLKEQLLLSVLLGTLKDEQEIKLRLSSINLPVEFIEANCTMIKVIQKSEDRSLTHEQTLESLKMFLQNEEDDFQFIISSDLFSNQWILALSLRPEEQIDIKLNEKFDQISKSMIKNFGIKYDFDRSAIYNNLIALSENMSKKNAYFISQRDVSEKSINIKNYRTFIHQYKDLVTMIINGQHEKIPEKTNAIFDQLASLPIDEVQRLSIDLLAMIFHSLIDVGINTLRGQENDINYHQILLFQNIDEIKSFCIEHINRFINHVNKINSVATSTDHLIKKAKEYINDNFNKDISLEEVSDHVFLNHAYFSRIFKKNTGQNFSEYLMHIRIEKAIQLLVKNEYKTYEISQMVGYKSSKYFSKVFKQVTGLTPRQYCRKYASESIS